MPLCAPAGRQYGAGCAGHNDDDTPKLGAALHEMESRFTMEFQPKDHSVEGHICTISVKDRNGNIILDGLGAHDSMVPLAMAAMNEIRYQ